MLSTKGNTRRVFVQHVLKKKYLYFIYTRTTHITIATFKQKAADVMYTSFSDLQTLCD